MNSRKKNLSVKQKKTVYIILIVFSLAYIISPVDIIADIVPIIGSVDDALVTLIPLVIGFMNIGKKDDSSVSE